MLRSVSSLSPKTFLSIDVSLPFVPFRLCFLCRIPVVCNNDTPSVNAVNGGLIRPSFGDICVGGGNAAGPLNFTRQVVRHLSAHLVFQCYYLTHFMVRGGSSHNCSVRWVTPCEDRLSSEYFRSWTPRGGDCDGPLFTDVLNEHHGAPWKVRGKLRRLLFRFEG